MNAVSPIIMGLLALSMSSSAVGKTTCPPREPGAAYPWQDNSPMPGDEWAELVLTVDANGKPQRCGVTKSNMKSETRLYTCQAMMKSWQGQAPSKDGVPVAGTVKTRMTLIGPRHRDANSRARKKFFREHPEERSECFPY